MFGEAAIKLGLLSERDVDFALAKQFDATFLVKGESSISYELLAAYHPGAPEIEALRRLRSTILGRQLDSTASGSPSTRPRSAPWTTTPCSRRRA